MKVLCKLIRTLGYMLLTVISVIVSNISSRYLPIYPQIFIVIVIFAAIYDGLEAGVLTGAVGGLCAGAYSAMPMWYATIYAIVGFIAGMAGEKLLTKNYVNIIILACIVSSMGANSEKVNITIYIVYSWIAVIAAAGLICPILRGVSKIGRNAECRKAFQKGYVGRP